MTSLNSTPENVHTSSAAGYYNSAQYMSSIPVFPTQYPPPPLPMPSPMPSMPPMIPYVQQGGPQPDISKVLAEVLNRINSLDTKLLRLDDIDKKLVKLDSVSENVGKLTSKVDTLSSEMESVKKRLTDVEQSSNFVGNKFDQINSDTIAIKNDVKKMSTVSNNQSRLLQGDLMPWRNKM